MNQCTAQNIGAEACVQNHKNNRTISYLNKSLNRGHKLISFNTQFNLYSLYYVVQ